MRTSDFFRPIDQTLLSSDWGTLTKHRFALKRSDGSWQDQVREIYDRGHAAVALLYNEHEKTVLLTKQFRLPVYLTEQANILIEAPAGLLEGMEPAARMREELVEETGFAVSTLQHVFSAYMSPGSVTEKLEFFTGTYTSNDQVSQGGGKHDEGEDIEVLHVKLEKAMAMIADGRIADAKTIMLVQHLVIAHAGKR